MDVSLTYRGCANSGLCSNVIHLFIELGYLVEFKNSCGVISMNLKEKI